MAPLAQWVLLLSSVAGLHGFRSLPTPVESANRLAGLLSAAKQYSSCRVRDPSIGRPFWHQRATRLWDAKQPSEGLDSVDPLDSLDQQILISLTARGAEVFDAVSGSEISKENVLQWEKKLREIATEIKMLKNQKILLSTYSSILKRAAPIELDPLQLTTFQIISQAVVDALLVIFPSNTPVTDLIDQLTDVHLNFIDQFQGIIDDGGDEE